MPTAEELLKEYERQPMHRSVIEIADVGRDDLATYLAKFCKVGLEVGVAHGKYSEMLMDANPGLTLYGVDPYEPYPGYKDFQLQRTFSALEADAHTRLDRFPEYHFIKKYSMDALADFEDDSLDFVYIDGNHAEIHVYQDIEGWTKKVKPGGVVAGHDYARIRGREHEESMRWDVIEAVHRYVGKHDIQLYIWGLNSKADRNLKRDSARSWMFLKP